MQGCLISAIGALVGGGLLASQIAPFESSAAKEIATHLHGDARRVTVKATFDNPIAMASGGLGRARITASNFSVDGLPLFVEPERSKAGKIGVLELRLSHFQLRAMRVEELSADIPGCRYDLGLARKSKVVRLSKSGEGSGYARLREEDLAAFIMRKYPELTDVSVRLQKYKAFVNGFGDFGVFRARFEVIADLVPTEDGKAISLAKAIVFLDDVRVRDGSERALLEAVNPVLDLDKDLGLAGGLRIERIQIGKGFVEVFGRARIPTRPTVPPG